MKKNIWLFGQHGSGKNTFINDIENDNIKKIFNLEGLTISYLDPPYDETNTNEYTNIVIREGVIKKGIEEFSNNSYDVLLINGRVYDFNNVNHNTLLSIANEYPQLEKEILFFNPSDIDVLYDRMISSEWYNSDPVYSTRYNLDWLQFIVPYLRKKLSSYEEYGFDVKEIDTTDGYIIHENIKEKIK